MQSKVITTDKNNRLNYKEQLLNKVETALNPPTPEPVLESEPIEIVEKYAKWISARQALQPADELLPEFKKEEEYIPQGEVEKRASVKMSLLKKVANNIAKKSEVEESEIEILDKYSNWAPAQVLLEPMEVLEPEFKVDRIVIPERETEKRIQIKMSLLQKIESALIPSVEQEEQEPEPVEIIEKYANWAPARVVIEPMDELPPEYKKEQFVFPPREIEKRAELKSGLANRVQKAFILPEPKAEPEPIEIIEKYSQGIPKLPYIESVEPVFPETKKDSSFIPEVDVPKRLAFRDKLARQAWDKLRSLEQQNREDPVEIVGYESRSVSLVGFDYPEIQQYPIPDPEPQFEIEDFGPIVEETPIPILRLPENFASLSEAALYGVLVRTPGLQHSSATANLTLDILFGRSSQQAEFEIISDMPKVTEHNSIVEPVRIKSIEIQEQFRPQDVAKRISFAESLVKKVQDLNLRGELEDEAVEHVDFDILDLYSDVPLHIARTDMLLKGVTPEEADALLAYMAIREPVPTETITNVREEIQVPDDLPLDFNEWKPWNQYIYLTKERKMTPDRANEVIWRL